MLLFLDNYLHVMKFCSSLFLRLRWWFLCQEKTLSTHSSFQRCSQLLQLCCSSVSDGNTQVCHNSVFISKGHAHQVVQLRCNWSREHLQNRLPVVSHLCFWAKTTIFFLLTFGGWAGEREKWRSGFSSTIQSFDIFSSQFSEGHFPLFAMLQQNKWLPEYTFHPHFFYFPIL